MRYCLDLPHGFAILGSWLYDWQTLVAGTFALFAGRFVWLQIRQAEKFHRDEINRHHNAARAVLPLALSAIGELCQSIVENIANQIEGFGENGSDTNWESFLAGEGSVKQFENLSISDDVIQAFQRFIETLTDKGNIRHVAELISNLQILLSRYNSLNLHQAGLIENLYGLLLDTAKVNLLNDRIFNYGRFVDDSQFSVIGTVSNIEAWDMIHRKAQDLVFLRKSPDLFFSRIYESIDRSKASGRSPWNEKFDD